nr:ORF2 [Torque teno virus]
MFLGKLYRKKRKLLLLPVRPAPTPSSMSSTWRVPRGDVASRERHWYLSVRDSHDAFCGCRDPVFHLSRLAARFNNQGSPPPPPGRPPDAGYPSETPPPAALLPGRGSPR